jgi:hypothetical protein
MPFDVPVSVDQAITLIMTYAQSVGFAGVSLLSWAKLISGISIGLALLWFAVFLILRAATGRFPYFSGGGE